MLAPEDIRRRAQSRYADYLRSVVTGTQFFPLPVRFGKPSPTEDFEKLRREISALTKANLGCQIEWVDVNSRRWGRQRLPERVTFPDESSYLRTLGKAKEVARFRENLALAREHCPTLIPFLQDRPLDVVEFAESWPGLVEVCCYLKLHPRPNLYARELPLSVDTKFVENHKAMLARLLPFVLPPVGISDSERFEERFGLRFEEPQIRLRFLDESLQATLKIPFSDFSIPVSRFRKLEWKGIKVIISENKLTFLTLPDFHNSIGVWGAGNAAMLLQAVPWLSCCSLIYWGDLDMQGLEILARLRGRFPHTRSVLMDLATLNRFRHVCVPGTPSKGVLPTNLMQSEIEAWKEVFRQNLRLEQERLPVLGVRSAISEAVHELT